MKGFLSPQPRVRQLQKPEGREGEHESIPYTIGTTVEELLEMLGVIVWIAVILQYGLEEGRAINSAEYVPYSLRHL